MGPGIDIEIFCRNIAFQLNWTATYSVHASVVDLMKTPPPRLHQLATSVTYGPIGPAWQVLEGVQIALRHATESLIVCHAAFPCKSLQAFVVR